MPQALQQTLAPVPSDIEIAQAATPIPIDRIADEIGVLPGGIVLRPGAARRPGGKGGKYATYRISIG